MKVRDGAKLALFLAACAACSSDYADGTPAVDFEAIIGGTAATAYPEAAYLNIDMSPSGGYACSGTLIAPRVVLTAGHCVDGHGVWDVYVGSAYRQSTSAAVYDWNENGAETVDPKHHDVGLVFLGEPVNLASYPTLSKTKVADNTKAVNVGRVLNGTIESALYQAPATISAADKIGYPYDYSSSDVIQPGDSGGPVFLAGTHTLVAVNSGAGSGVQVLARVDLVADWIASQITAHGGSSTSSGAGGSGGTSGAAGKAGASAGGSAGKPAAAGAGGTAGKPAAGASGSSGAAGAKAGASGAAGKAGAAAAGASSSAPACSGTKETEPNDTFDKASKLASAECGELSTTTDVDFYSVSASAGTHTLALTTSSDAVLGVGVVSGTNCVLSLTNVKSANVTISGGSATLCVKASSPGKKTQSYAISFK
ncbi:MAG TPA: trypsin-like serine protease [Polyangiaceae bacterium]|nr:trypsin-like serine protease [Polyangiaceae bacterium]